MRHLVGTVLQNGKYEIEQALGQGGFGITYRAIRQPLNQVVVIKTVNEASWTTVSQAQQPFQDEARRLAQCKHPHIVNVTDFFIEAGLPYLVMDYIPGRPLSELVAPGQPLPEMTALYYIAQIGDALQAVHRQGLLHRDVKPQNIMVHDLTGEAVLIDFGIARELTAGQTQTHTNLVSDGYAPVEQYLPKAHRSAATDVYGLAATLYTLVTGEVPVPSVLQSHQALVPPRQFCPTLSPATEGAILAGMALKLTDRPASVADWQAILQGRAPVTPIAPPIAPSARSAFSAAATLVVAPGYPANALPVEFTAAAPPSSRAARPARGRRRGPGLFSSLASIITLALLTGLGIGGYRLYQQATQTLDTLAQQPIFNGQWPDWQLPDVASWVEGLNALKPEPEAPAAAPAPADQPPANAEPPPNRTIAQRLFGQLPLLLGNSGSPETARPSAENTGPVAIPGFSPGTAASQVLKRLGEPTRQAIRDNFSTAVYELVPNRATIAYVYDQASQTVQQAEAAFAPSFDRLMMRVALTGMLKGESTQAIEQGLEQVRTQQLDRYAFENSQFEGTIERNQNGYIHIYVRPK
jgi:serine/threonine-protein kinase